LIPLSKYQDTVFFAYFEGAFLVLTEDNREEGDDWVKELEDEVRQEAEEKYGHVVHISVDPNSKGDIYLKFDKVQGGENAIKGLNGRYFGGRMIDASPVVDAVYSSLFSRTRAI
jgi:RNA-binding protein 39